MLAAVVVVAELLQGRGLEPVSLVDDQELDERRQGVGAGAGARSDGPAVRIDEGPAQGPEVLVDHPRGVTLTVGVYSSVCESSRSRAWVSAAACLSIGSSSSQRAYRRADRVLPTPGWP